MSNLQDIETSKCTKSPLNTRDNLGDNFGDFVDNVREYGIMVPVLARQLNGGFEIIAGSRRLEAAKQIGLETIPANVIEVDSEEEIAKAALIENLQRQDYDPIEEAEGYRWLNQHGLTVAQISNAVHVKAFRVDSFMALLDLGEEDKQDIKGGKLSVFAGHARARALRWLERKRAEMAQPQTQIAAVIDPKESLEYFDAATGDLAYQGPATQLLNLDDRPNLGERTKTANPRVTWRDLISGSEAGESVKITCVISPKWKPAELADQAAVKAYVRANQPGFLRAHDTNLMHGGQEADRHARMIWDLNADATLHAMESSKAASIEDIRTAIIACASRLDLEFIARRFRVADVHLLSDDDLRDKIAGAAVHVATLQLALTVLLIVAARRDVLAMTDHGAAIGLLNALRIDPGAIEGHVAERVK